jgi:phosphoribosyl-ATP pyrophosphohydrolase
MLTIPSNIKLLHHDTYKICSKIYEEADSMYISCFMLYRVQR